MSDDSAVKVDPLIGQVIQGRYKIVHLLGEGGMGSVYLAEQLSIGRLVALKVLHEQYARDTEFLARFRREAQQAAALNHHRVVTIYECGQTEDQRLFIAMEYVAGQTLNELIQRRPLPLRLALALGMQVAEALQAAHQAGVIHRDVKPENIMVREGDEVKLMDFGIARARDTQARTRLTRTGLILGTPEYIAPEQIEGKAVTEQTDIYAWGIVLYEMLSGRVPFTAPTPAALLVKHLQEPPPPLRKLRRDVPEEVERVVMQALEKKPRDRQRNMTEVIAGLQAALEQTKLDGTTGITAHPRPQEGGQRTEPAWFVRGALLLTTVMLSIAIGWFAVFRNRGATEAENPAVVMTEPAETEETDSAEDLAEIEEHDPTLADHVHASTSYLDLGQYDEAIAELEAAKALDPSNEEVLTQLERARRAQEAEQKILHTR